MERLSIPEIIAHCDRTLSRKSEGSIFYREHEAVKAYLNELQRYRETGLMPEEVKNWQDIYNEILTRTYGPFHQKIADWLKAEQEGRLVVVSVKPAMRPGHADSCVYIIEDSEIVEDYVTEVIIGECGRGTLSVVYSTYEGFCFRQECFGKTVFLTEDQAKAALEKGAKE